MNEDPLRCARGCMFSLLILPFWAVLCLILWVVLK